MHSRNFSTKLAVFLILFLQSLNAEDQQFPVVPEVFVSTFNSCEGIAFNGEGKLFVTAEEAVWEIETDGSTRRIADLYSTLGLAGVGERDLLVADFGPTNAFGADRNNDGMVWRISPKGKKEAFATGMGDPNFILVRKDGSLLVSDDVTNEIFTIDTEGTAKLFSTAVNHPNGLALSQDESVMYVAQIFKTIRPVLMDDSIWKVPLTEGKPIGGAELIASTGLDAANDGLAMDVQGRIYICANRIGKIIRLDPETGELKTLAENMYGSASIAFGEGDFDHESLYVATTNSRGRGGQIFRVPVGVKGAKLNR